MAAAISALPVARLSGHPTPRSPRRGPPPTAPAGRPAAARARAHPSTWQYRWRRAVALLLAAEVLVGSVLLAAAAVTAVVTSTASPAASAPVFVEGRAPAAEPEIIVVREGDTLWSIARELDPEGDPHALITELVERSGGAGLRPGQRLRVDGLR